MTDTTRVSWTLFCVVMMHFSCFVYYSTAYFTGVSCRWGAPPHHFLFHVSVRGTVEETHLCIIIFSEVCLRLCVCIKMYIIHSLSLLQSRTVSHVSSWCFSLSFTCSVTCSVCSRILMNILCFWKRSRSRVLVFLPCGALHTARTSLFS